MLVGLRGTQPVLRDKLTVAASPGTPRPLRPEQLGTAAAGRIRHWRALTPSARGKEGTWGLGRGGEKGAEGQNDVSANSPSRQPVGVVQSTMPEERATCRASSLTCGSTLRRSGRTIGKLTMIGVESAVLALR
ncbi:hypothetical protein HPB50_001749 [Hyalomma asiaticum]|uniref:Uncharacterized protein n=1 Tax=Hyalomma asiaticum TaxID=266040 RepID=A0ACB7T5N3_HYAAI|nr:hypothetical protein HPB50_001749 [Hyalomma asiaticum]